MNNGVVSHKFEHLTCFLPGLLALGVYTLPELTPRDKELHMWAAQGLAYTCYIMYADHATGLSPDEISMDSWSPVKDEGRWLTQLEEWRAQEPPSELPPGLEEVPATATDRDYRTLKDSYLLRPEVCRLFYSHPLSWHCWSDRRKYIHTMEANRARKVAWSRMVRRSLFPRHHRYLNSFQGDLPGHRKPHSNGIWLLECEYARQYSRAPERWNAKVCFISASEHGSWSIRSFFLAETWVSHLWVCSIINNPCLAWNIYTCCSWTKIYYHWIIGFSTRRRIHSLYFTGTHGRRNDTVSQRRNDKSLHAVQLLGYHDSNQISIKYTATIYVCF